MWVVNDKGWVINEEGKVALRMLQSTPKYIMMGDKTEYLWTVSRNISMAWVNQEHVDTLLKTVRNDCNCAKGARMFILGDQTHIARWLGLSDR